MKLYLVLLIISVANCIFYEFQKNDYDETRSLWHKHTYPEIEFNLLPDLYEDGEECPPGIYQYYKRPELQFSKNTVISRAGGGLDVKVSNVDKTETTTTVRYFNVCSFVNWCFSGTKKLDVSCDKSNIIIICRYW